MIKETRKHLKSPAEGASQVSQLDEPKEGIEVFARSETGPFEAKAETFVPGPYYKSVVEVMPELGESSDASKDTNGVDLAVDRRDFMRLFSASAMVASAGACIRRPEEKVVPYVNQPVDQVPGVATVYATTCGECSSGCGITVKTREGRPVKIEGNVEHPISQGSTCAMGQASMQGLYHPERRKKPGVKRGQRFVDSEWDEVYEYLGGRVGRAKNIGILTSGSTGNRPDFLQKFLTHMGSPKTNLYTYESNSLLSSMSKAHQIAFGADGIPRSDLRLAELIVGIGSDFLEGGVSPVYSNKSFSLSHRFSRGKKGKFIQFESGMTQTGSNADDRYPIPAGSELGATLLLIRALMNNKASKGSAGERAEIQKVLNDQKDFIDSTLASVGVSEDAFNEVAKELVEKKSVILCGGSANFDENATALQLAAIMANLLIGSYGSILLFDRGWMKASIGTGDMERFFQEAPKLDILFVIDTNPVFTMPKSSGISELLAKVPQIITIQSMPNETDNFASVALPGHHFLESWGDEEPVKGFWSARQPVVRPLTDSRQAEDILLWLAAAAGKPMKYSEYRDYMMERWKSVFDVVGAKVDYDTFFKAVLRRGFVGRLDTRSVRGFSGVAGNFKVVKPKTGLVLVSPLDPRLGDGRGADKPVLQEVGDVMTTVTWDTWLALNPNTAKKMGFKSGDLLKVEGPGGSFEAALYPLPGVHPDSVYVPRGNGHVDGYSKVSQNVGVNPLVAFEKAVDAYTGDFVTTGQNIKLSKTGKTYRLAAMQKHNDIDNRSDIVKKLSLSQAAVNKDKIKDLDDVPDLYPALPKSPQYRWGMSIDLDACTGCSACMVACSIENNIPQVGRQQIINGREMHWIRLDRYFAGDVNNPEVTIQPVMCQHCNHAPCEAVCPVYATTHDAEGLNSQTYNRCVGTRYCANACPYKVRRFNWFTHRWNMIGDLERDRNPRAMNPDITVRTRGIMEKCTMCVQRIRDGKHRAAETGTALQDDDVKTACQQVCPSNAIGFGNLFDQRSRISRDRKDNRSYLLLGGAPEHKHYGIKTLPNVNYLMEVTHKESVTNEHHDSSGHKDEHG